MKTISFFVFALLMNTFSVFAQTTFGEPQLLAGQTSRATSVYSCDISGDGSNDIIVASGNTVSWFNNSNGMGDFSQQHIITTVAEEAWSVYACDIDGDGDNDVLSASRFDYKIAWYKNMDGAGTFGPQQIISVDTYFAYDVYACDLDGDGDNDVLSASHNVAGDGKIGWFENTDGNGSFSAYKDIWSQAGGANSVYACDIDGDGDNDVLFTAGGDDKVSWCENMNGNGQFGLEQIITTTADCACSVFACDMDGDGDMDVLSASTCDDVVAWYENMNGSGTFGTKQIITDSANGANCVYASDIDGDNDMDVMVAPYSGDGLLLFENTNGSGHFVQKQTIPELSQYNRSVFATDIDGDGDIDIMSASFHTGIVAWYENTNGTGLYDPHLISTNAYEGSSLATGDMDGDVDNDVVSASLANDEIVWYENVDGNGSFSFQKVISNSSDGATCVFVNDIDGDGNLDVVAALPGNNTIAWFQNMDGLGTFSSQSIISDSAQSPFFVHACDFDGDGDVDVISASHEWNYDRITWYENDSLGFFGTQHIVLDTYMGLRSVCVCDFDGDGDQDVVTASDWDIGVFWFENTNGLGLFSQAQPLLWVMEPISIFVADMDADNDQDILTTSYYNMNLALYKNDGAGGFGIQQSIYGNYFSNTSNVFASDIDLDGFNDVIFSSDNGFNWWQNVPSSGTFNVEQILPYTNARYITTCDLDNDGDQDMLTISSDKIAWHENFTILSAPVVSKNNFSIYPNPSNEKLYFDLETNTIQHLQIFDITGKTILEETNIPTPESIDISTLKSGIYVLSIETDKGVFTSKFVKE